MLFKSHYRIVLIYVIVAALWIDMSDAAVAALFSDPQLLTFAQNIKGWMFVGITGAMLFVLINSDVKNIESANERLVDSYDQTIKGWVQVMDLRHKETKDHTQRVTRMTVALARELSIHGRELEYMSRGALLHDIGKIGIPDQILIKPGALDETEWVEMKKHPQFAYELMNDIDYLKPSVDIPYSHHERWNGSGYPRGLSGNDIPFAARIFAVIDVWDALCAKRVYKKAWPEEQVLVYLEQQSGIHFDPVVVQLFLDNYQQIKAAGEINIADPENTPSELTLHSS
ncbi:MAG: HD domain-containing phosphohydrolase [Amphritea sp.]